MASPDALTPFPTAQANAGISVSVVIPTRNRQAWLVTCLESVMSQQIPAAEIIVVDDGSSDGTADMLRLRYPEVRVVHTDGIGPAGARNVGIDQATSDYIAFLDSDDLWYPDTLAQVGSVLASTELPAMLCGRVTIFEGDDVPGLSAGDRRPTSYRASVGLLAALPLAEFPHPSAVVVKRNVLKAAQGFDVPAIPAEDLDLYLRIGASGGCAVVESPPLALRRQHPAQLSANLDLAWSGLMRVVKRERAAVYGGGARYAAERRRLISECGRFYVPLLLADRRWSQALRLGLPSFAWTLRYASRWLPGWMLICWRASLRPLKV
jgi:glycosyltransferase involved in cell wall biosynthesis